MRSRQGAIHLFQVAGIDVFLHWSWFLIATIEIGARSGSYSSNVWNILEYLSLFVMVLLHEFGHALACRQVGGFANQIVLWPLGGIAYVDPPPRPGATLWSLAAGPLVNVALAPLLWIALLSAKAAGWPAALPDAYALLQAVFGIDLGLLAFNLLPIYPLDGGQMLRSLLWFWLGRARSLMVTTIIGFVGVAGLLLLAIVWQSVWVAVISVYILTNCWGGWKHSRALSQMAKLPRRDGFTCPWCKAAPPVGEFWKCGKCETAFDAFQSHATCPHCAAQFGLTRCLDCGKSYPMSEWMIGYLEPVKL